MSRDSMRYVMPESMRRIFRMLGFAFVLSAAMNIMMLAMPLYITQIYQRVLPSRHFDTLIALTVVIVGTLIVAAILDAIRTILVQRVAGNFDADLGNTLLQGSIMQPTLYGGTAEALRDLGAIRNFVGGRGCIALLDIPFCPFFVAVMFIVHWLLGLITLVAVVIVIALWVISEFLTSNPQRRAHELTMGSQQRAETYARNGAPIRAMGMIRQALSDWNAQYRQMLELNDRASTRNAWFHAASGFIRSSLQVAVLGAGAYLVINDSLTPGLMLASSILATKAITPLQMAIGAWRPFNQARFAYKRVRQIVANTTIPQVQNETRILEGRVEFEHVVYRDRNDRNDRSDRNAPMEPAIKGVSFAVKPGEVLGILGPTGSGKSTLGRLMVGAADPSAGAVKIDGVDIRGCDRNILGRDIGYYAQHQQLIPGTVAQNVTRFTDNTDSDALMEALRAANAESIFSALKGPGTEIRPGQRLLTPGQEQSLLIARAFYGSPKLLVLDNPTSELDLEGERAVVRALAAAKHRGATVVVIAPRQALYHLLDRVMMMKSGRIEKLGPREEVLRPPRQGGQGAQAGQGPQGGRGPQGGQRGQGGPRPGVQMIWNQSSNKPSSS